MRQIGPKWMKPAFEQRFYELARQAEKLKDMERLQKRQRELERMLKKQLSSLYINKESH